MELLTPYIRTTQHSDPVGEPLPQVSRYHAAFGAARHEDMGRCPEVLLSLIEPNARSIPDEGHGKGCKQAE